MRTVESVCVCETYIRQPVVLISVDLVVLTLLDGQLQILAMNLTESDDEFRAPLALDSWIAEGCILIRGCVIQRHMCECCQCVSVCALQQQAFSFIYFIACASEACVYVWH